MAKTIISIGREYAGGGHAVGFELSKRLSIPLYDKELLDKIKEDGTYSENFLSQYEEQAPGLFFIPSLYGAMNYDYQQSFSSMVFETQRDKIRVLAEKTGGVFIGRCSDFILKDMNPIKVFIYSSMENRIKRVSEDAEVIKKGLNEKDIIKLIQTKDKERSKYYEFYTGEQWGNKKQFDMCINTSVTGVQGAADLILAMMHIIKGDQSSPNIQSEV